MRLGVYVAILILIVILLAAVVPQKRTVEISSQEMFVYPAETAPGFVLVYGQGQYYQETPAPAGCYTLVEPLPLAALGQAIYEGPTCPK